MIHPNTPNEIAAAYEERLDALRQQLAECRRNTLLEAAEYLETYAEPDSASYVLRRMAGE